MIKIINLSRVIKSKKIINNINLEIKKGEKIALVGPNGAGKTTLIETLLGIQKKTKGEVIFDFEFKRSPTEKIGVQFQDANFPQGLTTRRLFEFFKEKTLNVDHKFINYLICKMGINEFLDTGSWLLSGGQAQKMNIFLALLNKPEILFLDELTTGLDVSARNNIREIVKNYLTPNITMILVTHIPSEIETFANRIIEMKNGRIVHDYSKKEILKKYHTIEGYLSQI